MQAWTGRKVLVLGLGDSGLSMARWLARHGAQVSVADTREAPPHARQLAEELPDVPVATGPFTARVFQPADTIAISPGIDRREPLVADALRRGVPVVGDVEIFCGALTAVSSDAGQPRVLAITGSNGKTTVTAMTGEVCRAAGRTTVVAGNIGLPVLDALAEIERGSPAPDVFVLELSSFQLESTCSLRADAATVLNVTEDHLDRYAGMADYAAAKGRIFEGARVQVVNRDDWWSASMAHSGAEVTRFSLSAPVEESDWGISRADREPLLAHGGQPLMRVAELPIAGLHNAANALASLALAHSIDLPIPPLLDGLRRFKGLPHRVQKIAELRGVTFYDDSKGTNVGATVAALTGMSAPVVLIAGGDGKGQDFSPLAGPIGTHARAVVLIGRDAPAIESVVRPGVPVARAKTMAEAVEIAYGATLPGDVVLLSPACASFDMFRSYVHRAEVYADAVHALVAREGGT
jgi:UDP-N-acetylmuramoylalanine--D-glutamate ligase